VHRPAVDQDQRLATPLDLVLQRHAVHVDFGGLSLECL
jgi:hypothetical protein